MADDRMYIADKVLQEYCLFLKESGDNVYIYDKQMLNEFFESRVLLSELIFFREADKDSTVYNKILDEYEDYRDIFIENHPEIFGNIKN